MPRTKQVSRNGLAPELTQIYDDLFPGKDPVADPGTATGTPGNWWTTFALVPNVLLAIRDHFGALRSDEEALPAKYREIAIVRSGWVRGSQFVFSQHCKVARQVGVPEDKIMEIPTWSSSSLFDPDERAVLAYVDEVMLADGRVQDATFERLRKVLSDEGIVRLTMCALTWGAHGTFCRALRLEYDDLDERVVEIPAPATATG